MKNMNIDNYSDSFNENGSLVEGERYSVTNVTTIAELAEDKVEIKFEPLNVGVEIQEKLPNGTYCTILSVMWDDKNKETYFVYNGGEIDTLTRLVAEIKKPKKVVQYLEEYLNCIEFAENLLYDLNEVKPLCEC